jgi:ABC-type glycerol-3-phosphate transport system permease component
MYDVVRSDLSRKLSFHPQFRNLVRALVRETGGSTFVNFFINSMIVAVKSIIGHLFSCTVVAYGFARMRAPGRDTLFAILIATLMMPGFITVIPVYRIFRDLNLIDTLWPMFIRGFFGSAFFIFLLRQFFRTIPVEMEEAARIDGANRVQIFFRIVLPHLTPALATIVIFTFLWSWNDTFNAAIFLNSPQNYTVAIGLRQFLGQYSAEFNLLMAAATVVMLPTILLFFVAQRYFIEGITLTGMKG